MRISRSDTLISIDMELERTLRRIRKIREAPKSKCKPMENLKEVRNKEDVESRSERSSHPSIPPMANSLRALRDYALSLAVILYVIRRLTIKKQL